MVLGKPMELLNQQGGIGRPECSLRGINFGDSGVCEGQQARENDLQLAPGDILANCQTTKVWPGLRAHSIVGELLT